MIKKIAITQSGWLLILMVVIIAFTGYNNALINMNISSGTDVLEKQTQVLDTVNDTVTNTDQLIQTGNRTNVLINELRTTQQIIEEQRANQTEALVPPLIRQFNQTDRIERLIGNISEIEHAAEERAQRLLPPFEDMMRNMSILNEKFDMLLNRSSSLFILS